MKTSFRDFVSGDFITEGLIKIPQNLFDQVISRLFQEYLSYAKSIDTDGSKSDDIKKLMAKYNVDTLLPSSFDFTKNKEEDLKIDVSDLPEKYQKFWKLEFGKLSLFIDWDKSKWGARPKVNASYEEKEGTLTVNPRAFIELITSDKYSLNAVIELFEKLKYSMWHELSHAVQHNSLKWQDAGQVGKSRAVRDNPDSNEEDKRTEYLTAMVEYDPQIKTAINAFREKHLSKITDEKELKAAVLQYVGAGADDGIAVGAKKAGVRTVSEFFKALKRSDIKKWKKAIKLFYLYFKTEL